jgi:hypothetical protein
MNIIVHGFNAKCLYSDPKIRKILEDLYHQDPSPKIRHSSRTLLIDDSETPN